MTITFGWWALPLLITIGAFVIASTASRDRDLGGVIERLIIFGLALIVSLVSWLIWAVLT